MEEKLIAKTVRMPESLSNEMRVFSALSGVSVNTVMVLWLACKLDDEKASNPKFVALLQAIEDGE